MRDILISGIIFVLMPYILRSPVIGVYAWTWLSMMSPHRAVYGFAKGLPFAQMVAIATMIGMVFKRRDRRAVPLNFQIITLLMMLAWMGFTSFFAIADSDLVLTRVVFVSKIQAMIFVTLMLVRGRVQIERLIWVMTASIAFFGVKGGFWTLATGGGGRVWGPPGLLEGNNELAVALVMMVPLMVYLLQVNASRWIRLGLIVSIVFTCFGILGTQSRGALLAIASMGFFLAIKGKRPVVMGMVVLLLMISAIAFMPDTWTQRMDSIQSYELDGSAQSRLYTWRTLLNCALDRPLVGAGFAADNSGVFSRYAPKDQEFDALQGTSFVAHSIYFQMLGEHGFPGLILFLLLGLATWRKASQLARLTRDDVEFGRWVPQLMPMLQVGLIGYAVGGAFLSLAYLDVPYYIMALVVLVDATWQDHKRSLAKAGSKAFIPTGAPTVSSVGNMEAPTNV